MKDLIKKLLRESLLGEAMLTSKDLPKETALFSKNDGIYLSLYDPMTRTTYGMISASLRGQNYSVVSVAAEKGFGPYMYEFAMMTANQKGKGLMPARDGDVRSEALDVWYRFYDRADVKKQTLAPFDASGNHNPEYSIAILSGDEDFDFENPEEFKEWWDDLDDSEQKVMNIFNSVYFMAPNQDYRDMLARGLAYNKKGMNPSRPFTAAQQLFMQKYD